VASVQVRTGGYKNDPVYKDQYTVSGVTTPDVTGLYLQGGGILVQPAYEREDHAWWLWTDHYYNVFRISETFEDWFPCWERPMDIIEGEYQPKNGAVGIATVS